MSITKLKLQLSQTFSSLKFKVSQLRPKKTYFALVLLVLAIPFTILLASQQQIFRQNAANAPLAVSIVGNHLVNSQGQTIRLIGINQEVGSRCSKGSSIFVGPSDQTSVVALTKWHINTVRITMNEDCWLGINNSPAKTSGSNYRNAIIQYIHLLHTYGMYAIIDLHMNAPDTHLSVTQQTMADADHGVTYWQSVASTFKNDPAVIFEPYNEPDVTTTNSNATNPWDCWLHGCTMKYLYSDFYTATKTSYTWQSTGMQQLVTAIRSTGATNVITLGGLSTAHNLSQLLANLPSDPQHQLAATFHNYERAGIRPSGCGPGSSTTPDCWDTVILSVAKQMPVITDELGGTECQTNYASYVTKYMNWADQHGISYLPWGWFVYTGDQTCTNTHQYDMLKSWDGTPNYYGQVFFDHFAQINPNPSVSSSPTISNNPTQNPTNCQPDNTMVNPCRPWFGAAVAGNPQAHSSNQLDQFNYLENLIGHKLDIYRQYNNCKLSGTTVTCSSQVPMTKGTPEYTLGTRANTYVDINWKPASTWADAGGSNQTINAEIKQAADNIKTIAPKKVFLTVWHEPQNDVIKGSTNCIWRNGTAGTPSQYIAMWQNVENIFKQEGVTNVIWTMDLMSTDLTQFDCQVPQLWPGSNLVNWVIFDVYGTDSHPTWAEATGRIYGYLSTLNPTLGLRSKPWGIGEFGTCGSTNVQDEIQYYKDAKTAFDNNTYPNLKMYLIWDDYIVGNGGFACLTNYDPNGTVDTTKQAAFTAFADDVLGSQIHTSPSPSTPPSSPPSVSPSPGNGKTNFFVTVCPHDLGNCGDNANPVGNGNQNAKHQSRPVTLSFFTNSTTPVATVTGNVGYVPGQQDFQGQIQVGGLSEGNYVIKVAMRGYLVKQLPGVVTVSKSHEVKLPEVSLTTGDVNNDNELNILDYNSLISCFENNASASSCPSPITATNTGADLDDNGVVDIVDINIFLRELATQQGAGDQGGQPTPTPIQPTPTPIASGYQVVGNKILMPNGSRYVPYGFVLECLGRSNFSSLCKPTAKDPNNDNDKIKAIANFWQGNTVRLQVAPENLFHSQPFDANFVKMMDNEVSLANSLNMVVILTLQEEEYKGPPFPTQTSLQFWQFMANHYKNNPRVFFDLYNEPQLSVAAAGGESNLWNIWQNGGTAGGKTYVGFQALVNTIRGQEANNIIIAEANLYDKDLTQMPTHHLTGGNIAYGVEPNLYKDSRTPQQWFTNFGQYTTNVPIMPEAFRDNQGNTCDPNSPVDVPQLFNYLTTIQMGAIVWTLAPGISTTGTSLTSPTSYNGVTTVTCPSGISNIDPNNKVGPGADILSLFKANSVPQQ